MEKKIRRSAACSRCRKQKLACIYGSEGDSGPCGRCVKLGLANDCVPHVPKPYSERGARKETETRSMDATELGSSTSGSQSGYGHVHVDDQTSGSTHVVSEQRMDGLLFGEYFLKHLQPPREPNDEQIIKQLSWHKAELLIAKYRHISRTCPFVIIPETVSAGPLAEEKPFLLLAILAVASEMDKPGQRIYIRKLREEIGRRVVVEGEKSLELLQGLLIYLAWTHHYIMNQTQQIYQFIQLALGMVVDLGLCDPRYVGNRWAQVQSDLAIDGAVPVNGDIHGKRAALGCYYMSVSFSVLGFNKPQQFLYSEYLLQNARELASRHIVDSDRHLPLMVELCHTIENSRNLLWSTHADFLQDATLRELSQLKQYYEIITNNDTMYLHSTYLYAYLFIYECNSNARNVSGSLSQIKNLLATMDSALDMLDYITGPWLQTIADVGASEWTTLIACIVVASRTLVSLRQLQFSPNDASFIKVQDFTNSLFRHIDTIQEHMSASVNTTYFRWWIGITTKLKKRVLSSTQSSKGAFMYDETNELSVEAESESTAKAQGQASGLEASTVVSDNLKDVDFGLSFFTGFWFENTAALDGSYF